MSLETTSKITPNLQTFDLYRVDLNHDVGGMVTYFRRTAAAAEELAVMMRILNWHAAVRCIRAFETSNAVATKLCNNPWPNADIRQLAALCCDPGPKQTQAISDLRRAIARRPRG